MANAGAFPSLTTHSNDDSLSQRALHVETALVGSAQGADLMGRGADTKLPCTCTAWNAQVSGGALELCCNSVYAGLHNTVTMGAAQGWP